MHNPAYPAARSCILATVPRDHVAVRVQNGLTGNIPDVHTDIVSIRMMPGINQFPAHIDKTEHCHPLVHGHGEQVARMPERYDEQVTPADREPVIPGITELVPGDDVRRSRIAEGTGFTGIHAGSDPLHCL